MRQTLALLRSIQKHTRTLDSAFVDRADIIQYVDLPPREAIYDILRSCLSELVNKGIVNDAVSQSLFKTVDTTKYVALGCPEFSAGSTL